MEIPELEDRVSLNALVFCFFLGFLGTLVATCGVIGFLYLLGAGSPR